MKHGAGLVKGILVTPKQLCYQKVPPAWTMMSPQPVDGAPTVNLPHPTYSNPPETTGPHADGAHTYMYTAGRERHGGDG